MITSHTYTATVKRPGRRDAILNIRGGRISLDATGSPRCLATIETDVPRHWAPITANDEGYWEDTGAPQYPFFPGPPLGISAPAKRWVPRSSWVNAPKPDEPDVVYEDGPQRAFFMPGLPLFISSSHQTPVPFPPREADLRDIDPRDNPRLVIVATRTDAFGGTQQRTFDLTLRTRSVSQSTGRVELSLASDEALLQDYAPIADDRYPFYVTSMFELVQYVLATAIPGVVLDSVPTARVVRPVWSTTQTLINGTFRSDLAGWGSSQGSVSHEAGGGAEGGTGYARVRHNYPAGSFTGGENIDGDKPETHWVAASPGARFTVSAAVRAGSEMKIRLGVAYRDATGAVLVTHLDEVARQPRESWERFNYTAPPAPIGTTRVSPVVAWEDSLNARVMFVDDVMLVSGEFDPGWFDGSTPATATYRYAWRGDANASQSERGLLIDGTAPESLIWRAGVDAFSFINTHAQAAGWRLVCDENRVWKVRAEDARNAGHIDIGYAETMIDGSDRISREDGTWCDAAVVTYRWTSDGLQRTQQDAYALTTPHTRARRVQIDAPYPGPGLAEYIVRRAQGRGRVVTATAVADWHADAEMNATVVLNGAPQLTGVTDSVEFDLDRDEMTITTRTTDTGRTS